MKILTRKSLLSINRPQISQPTLPLCQSHVFAPALCLARVVLVASLSFIPLSSFDQASATSVTNVFTAVTDLSFFGGNGTDEFRLTYTFDTDLVPQVATAGLHRYGPITGNVRADSIGGFDFDFDSSNLNNSLLAVSDNAALLGAAGPVDIFSISFSTTSDFSFGGESLRGFALSLIDEQATVFSSPALESGTGFFAEIDAINLRFIYPLLLDSNGFPVNASMQGPGFFTVPRDGASLAGISAVPLPAALPLFAVGLGLLGLLGWRRKQKALAIA